MGTRLLQTLNDHAHRTVMQMSRIDSWAEEKNQVIADSEALSRMTKESLDSVTNDMKEMKEKMEWDRKAVEAARRVEAQKWKKAEKANEELVGNVRAGVVTIQKIVEQKGKNRLSKERIKELKKSLRGAAYSVKASSSVAHKSPLWPNALPPWPNLLSNVPLLNAGQQASAGFGGGTGDGNGKEKAGRKGAQAMTTHRALQVPALATPTTRVVT